MVSIISFLITHTLCREFQSTFNKAKTSQHKRQEKKPVLLIKRSHFSSPISHCATKTKYIPVCIVYSYVPNKRTHTNLNFGELFVPIRTLFGAIRFSISKNFQANMHQYIYEFEYFQKNFSNILQIKIKCIFLPS